MSDDLAYNIIGCVLKVHSKLGPGLLESVYQKALMIELDNECLLAEEEVPLEVMYDDQNLGIGFRMDILVEDQIVLELNVRKGSLQTTTDLFEPSQQTHGLSHQLQCRKPPYRSRD